MPLIRVQYPEATLVFIDDRKATDRVNGHQIVDWMTFLRMEGGKKSVCIAIAASKTREAIARRVDDEGIALIEARAVNAVQMDNVTLGEGACISPFVTLTSNIRIGRCFHANLYSYVEHDCSIGDYVTLAPGAKVNGNVTIGDYAYVGSGAVIRQGVTIGADAVIGMGSVVTRDVPPGVTVIGNPACPMEK